MVLTFYPCLVDEDTTVRSQAFVRYESEAINRGRNVIPANAKQM